MGDETGDRRLTVKERKAELALDIELLNLRVDIQNRTARAEMIPPEWHQIERDHPCASRVKITLRLDADVAKFYRAMGEGYGARINAILRSWMLARLAKVIEGELDRGWKGEAM